MNPRTAPGVAKQVKKSIRKGIKRPSPTALGPRRNRGPNHEHGQQIFVYNHLQKNMMLYSLTKALKNNAALRQIPFNGKKTVPAALRKDLWHPFAEITFPKGLGTVGLSAYQKLREYRKRHELEWGDEIRLDKEGKPVNKKARGRLICDQKANSVADIAAVLGRLNLEEKATPEIEDGETVRTPSIGLEGEGTGVRVEVRWRDLMDAEFAETWTDNVEHGILSMHTNNRDPDRIWGRRKALLAAKNEESTPRVETVEEPQPEKAVL